MSSLVYISFHLSFCHVTSKDIENYVIKVHGQKSTSKMIGAMGVSDTAKYLEEKGNDNTLDHDEHSSLMRQYKECIENIRAFLALGSDDTSASTDAISEDEYQALLTRIKDAADEFDAGEFMILDDELPKIAVDSSHKEEFEKLADLISTLSFSEVYDMLS